MSTEADAGDVRAAGEEIARQLDAEAKVLLDIGRTAQAARIAQKAHRLRALLAAAPAGDDAARALGRAWDAGAQAASERGSK